MNPDPGLHFLKAKSSRIKPVVVRNWNLCDFSKDKQWLGLLCERREKLQVPWTTYKHGNVGSYVILMCSKRC